MAHQGPNKGAQPRTLRGVALDKGTASGGLDDGVAYNPQHGIPTSAGQNQDYDDKALSAFPTGKKTSQGVKPF